MSKESEQILIDLKRELANIELYIEQAADQGDTELVEYYVEQQAFLTKQVKQLEAQV